MCGIEPFAKILIWIFVVGSICMAVLSRKLNEHLLAPPPPPKHIWFRKKNHIKPSYLMKPDLYFDQAGQPWAWRFTLIAALTLATGLLSFYALLFCR